MVKDIISGDSLTIVAFNISTDPVFMQIQDMLDKAFFNNTNLEGLILHFDQGWQYQQKPYQSRLKNKGIKQSMSRKGNCLDNSPIENIFSIMKMKCSMVKKIHLTLWMD